MNHRARNKSTRYYLHRASPPPLPNGFYFHIRYPTPYCIRPLPDLRYFCPHDKTQSRGLAARPSCSNIHRPAVNSHTHRPIPLNRNFSPLAIPHLTCPHDFPPLAVFRSIPPSVPRPWRYPVSTFLHILAPGGIRPSFLPLRFYSSSVNCLMQTYKIPRAHRAELPDSLWRGPCANHQSPVERAGLKILCSASTDFLKIAMPEYVIRETTLIATNDSCTQGHH